MPRRPPPLPVILAGLVGAAALGLWWWAGKSSTAPDPEAAPPAPSPVLPPLSELAEAPDWQRLEPWQEVVSRDEFVRMMERVYTVSPRWRDFFHVGESDVLIETGVAGERFRLRFAPMDRPAANPRHWRSAFELGPDPEGQPLAGLRVAIDPGHIGGRWAKVEERWFQVGDGKPVTEGDMTLFVARLIQPRLKALGAEVSLVRDDTEPVTPYRPESLLEEARATDPVSPRKLAERLFYRTAEIRERARLVNEELKPDLVLCLHFNAEAWGNPEDPQLVEANHFHILLHGAYTDEEVGLADQRFRIVRKIVDQTHLEEAAISQVVAASFIEKTGLPPYLYEPNSSRAVNVAGNPYLWARNLLANRLYDCPVIFLEPYVMNSQEAHARIQAGDYDGTREVAGKPQPSIFREYADAVVDGLARYYRLARPETF